MDKEHLQQVICVFRHGRRNEIVNMKKGVVYGGEMDVDAFEEVKEKGRMYMERFVKEMDVNVEKDVMLYVSDYGRTIRTLVGRIVGMFGDVVKEDASKEELGERFKVVFDSYMFVAFTKCGERLKVDKKLLQKYEVLYKQIKDKIDNDGEVLMLLEKCLNLEIYAKMNVPDYIRLLNVCDYYKNTKDTLNDTDIKLQRILHEMNIYKKILDFINEEKDYNIIFNCRLLSAIKHELTKPQSDMKKLILFSGHDDNLSSLLKAFGIDFSKFNYDFNDELSFIHTIENNAHFIKIFYNDTLLQSSLSNSTKCPLDTFISHIEHSYTVSQSTYDSFCSGETETLC